MTERHEGGMPISHPQRPEQRVAESIGAPESHLARPNKHRPAEPGAAGAAGGAGTHLLGDGGVRSRRGRGAGASLGLHVPVEQSLALLRVAAAAQRRHLITESRGPSDRCWAGRGKGGGGRGEAEAEGGGRRGGTAGAAPAAAGRLGHLRNRPAAPGAAEPEGIGGRTPGWGRGKGAETTRSRRGNGVTRVSRP